MGDSARTLNIECLRCIAMFFIVLNHCILNLATNEYTLERNFVNFCITDFVYQTVYNGVNVFILISGYFLVKTTRETTNWEKTTKLWLNAFFYSVTIYVILIVLHYKSFDAKNLIHALMPVRYDSYWFITQYLGLYIMSPFLSKWARSMSKKEYQTMLVSFFIITSIIQLQGLKGGFSLIWFIFLFMFAGYIQLQGGVNGIIPEWKQHAGITFIMTSSLLFIISLPINGNKLNIVGYWGFYNGPLLFIASVSLFLFFLKMKESNAVRIISKLSPYMLGVYLIHEHPIFKDWLWKFLHKNVAHTNIFHLLIIALVIMAICIPIEYVRQLLFKIFRIDTLFYKNVKFLLSPVTTILKYKNKKNV